MNAEIAAPAQVLLNADTAVFHPDANDPLNVQLTKNFNLREFTCTGHTKGTGCGCGGLASVNPVLVTALQQFRDHIGRRVTITSGLRCRVRNEQVGGALNSQHLYGNAADIIVAGFPPDEVYEYFEENHWPGGLGKYGSFTHIDVRPYKVRF